MTPDDAELVDRATLRGLHAAMGAGLAKLLGYFREDGGKAVAQIEQALAAGSSAALVMPAHGLKGEALQLGAEPLGRLAESIEHGARRCVEAQAGPEALAPEIDRLRPLFDRTLAALLRTAAPARPPVAVAQARPVFGRKSFG